MIRYFCDRCGKEITAQRKKVRFCSHETYQDYSIDDYKVELCEECYSEIKDFARDKDTEPEDSVEVAVPGTDGHTTMQIAACCAACGNCYPREYHGAYGCRRDARYLYIPERGRECPWYEPEQEG